MQIPMGQQMIVVRRKGIYCLSLWEWIVQGWPDWKQWWRRRRSCWVDAGVGKDQERKGRTERERGMSIEHGFLGHLLMISRNVNGLPRKKSSARSTLPRAIPCWILKTSTWSEDGTMMSCLRTKPEELNRNGARNLSTTCCDPISTRDLWYALQPHL